ncbi:uncharacterized protein ACN427_009432 isoform 1-T1 [Glossina fuscipes fuscipes]
MVNVVFLLISTAYKDLFCAAPGEYLGGPTIGHYTAHIGVATNDPCTLPGPEGTNYYLKWNHGRPFAGLRRPTHKKYGDCFESVIFNKLGYYLWVPPESDKIGMCVSPSGNYVWHHGQLPKEKQREGVVPSTPTLTDFVFPEDNSTMKSLLGSIPPPDEEYTETPEAVTVSPQTVEAGPMIIPAPQEVTLVPIPEAEPTIIPAPQGPEVVTTAPIQTGPYTPAPSYYPPSYLPPGTTSMPKTVNIFL